MILSFSDIIKKYNMDIRGIIHIGAHRGEEISEYLKNGFKDIIMFEPLCENFKYLEENIKNLNVETNISTYQVALGNEEKDIIMYLSDNNLLSSSILKPKIHLNLYPTIRFSKIEKVQMKRLDSFIEKTKEFNFINIDVQGYELEVLKGGEKTLNSIDYIYCEVNRDELYEGNTLIDDLDKFLHEYNMERVETNWAGILWGDALYIRKGICN